MTRPYEYQEDFSLCLWYIYMLHDYGEEKGNCIQMDMECRMYSHNKPMESLSVPKITCIYICPCWIRKQTFVSLLVCNGIARGVQSTLSAGTPTAVYCKLHFAPPPRMVPKGRLPCTPSSFAIVGVGEGVTSIPFCVTGMQSHLWPI